MNERKEAAALNPEININTREISQIDATCLARQTLRAVERYFARPGIQEDYERWLGEYQKRKGAPHENI